MLVYLFSLDGGYAPRLFIFVKVLGVSEVDGMVVLW